MCVRGKDGKDGNEEKLGDRKTVTEGTDRTSFPSILVATRAPIDVSQVSQLTFESLFIFIDSKWECVSHDLSPSVSTTVVNTIAAIGSRPWIEYSVFLCV